MIVLFTDFGNDGLYTGQVHAVLAQTAPGVPVINLTHTAPQYDIRHSAYLLAAYIRKFPVNSVVMAVVDPGVGSERKAIILQTNKRWYVGPDNGLLEMVASAECINAVWDIEVASDIAASFHGRDVFAPVAGKIARGWRPAENVRANLTESEYQWPDDLYEIIYIDQYGNLITGINAEAVSDDHKYYVRNKKVSYARVFSSAPDEELFWYRNSNGLVEIATNMGSAAMMLGVGIGEKINNN